MKFFDHPRIRDLGQASAPYWAVFIGLYCFRNAWFSLLLYHFQIVLYACFLKPDIKKILCSGFSGKEFLRFVLPVALLGPFLFYFLPVMMCEHVSLAGWLQSYGLTEKTFFWLFPYFGGIHPVLEEIHWSRFRGRGRFSWMMYVLFAGYHVLVLGDVLKPLGLAACFFVLVAAACVWDFLYVKLKGGCIPFLSHLAGDLGIIGAAVVLLRG